MIERVPTVSVVIITKNEASVRDTLSALTVHESQFSFDITVVDASTPADQALPKTFPDVTWISYRPDPQSDKRTTIPEQRNAGVRATLGRIVAFIDSGCEPTTGWLDQLVAPIVTGEEAMTVGSWTSRESGVYDSVTFDEPYVREAPTLNMAFERVIFDYIGGFDEDFSYGSDVDFCWRVTKASSRIRRVRGAEITVDWGNDRRQLRRAWHYGAARARLYSKHRYQLPNLLKYDPMLAVYPAFLLGLPLTLVFPVYPLLLLLPLWRNRHHQPLRTVVDHLTYGAGALVFILRLNK